MAVENLITEHIDIWTSAVKTKSTSGRGSSKKLELYGVKKLRELILELAVRGKLVPQDPNDEPATVLLERIAQEKAQLIKDKKIKKTKPLSSVKEQEKTFDIPRGWSWTRIGLITTFVNGFAFKSSSFQDSGVGIVKIGDISFAGELTPNTMSRVDTSVIKDLDPSLRVNRGDMVIAMSGATTGKVGFNTTNEVFYLNQRVGKFIPHQIDLDYLFFPLTTKIAENLEKSLGSAIPNLSTGQINDIVIALPPLQEQHRIVAKVDELMTLCDQLEQQTEASIEAHQVLVTTLLNTLTNSADADELMQNWARISEHFDTLFTTEESIDQLKQAILQLAVMGKLVSFGNSRKTMLKELLSFGPRNGLSPKEAPSRTELKVLKLGATSYGSLDLEQSKYIDVDIKDKPYLCLTRGDILIQRGNSANFVGSNVLIQEDYHNYIYPDLMMKLRVNQLISPEFLSLVLSANASREHMWKQMTGTSGTMPKISKKVVEGLPVTFPTNKNIQVEVVSQTNKLIALCDKLRTRLTGCSETKATLCDVMTQQAY
ncbi:MULTISPECIES: restriction endonuclease subunit S [Vibrio]|jgi:type I restriction enzyme S subunit|uniref:restriction endonuclease subunit S n=1 Tax=Vibrio TaxID=662 RepID=UPI000DF47E00|nr:restriction endonuclease subunit S [Vibrio parahaemolyticus]BDP35866.1 type I restriction endonuclease EcoAI subunit S [Vibrio alginolyticus]MDG2603109.1 restriction endonuclease subunit S [Vibrio parahaemolyticus]MEA5307643.1 restriction endonuclease subunit S [Vibrio parahaemolyticus]RCW26907.1 type I restriction enzyme S subunit [Vibrio parahaemolyticus]WOO28460.1 restriction endonuclease subunit S [Vibrio parahaemolyticus]